MKQIQKEHIALIIKYTGISFITGWLSHWLERDYIRTIIFSSILAVAIWALTWGLQHFPDSPDRSVWLVPVWFLVSIGAYLALEKEIFYKKAHLVYTWVGFIFFVWVSALLYSLVQSWYLWAWEHGHGDDSHQVEDNITIEKQVNTEMDSVDWEIVEDSDVNFKWDGHTDHDH